MKTQPRNNSEKTNKPFPQNIKRSDVPVSEGMVLAETDTPKDDTMSNAKLSAADRAYNRFKLAVEKDQKVVIVTDLAREKAFGQTVNAWLSALVEEELTQAFAQFEMAASASNARKIATHPMRPETVDALLERKRSEREAAKRKPPEGRAKAVDVTKS